MRSGLEEARRARAARQPPPHGNRFRWEFAAGVRATERVVRANLPVSQPSARSAAHPPERRTAAL